MTDWFRSWHGAPTDNKWLVIARKAGVAPGIVSAIVWALFDHASQQDDRGCVRDFDIETYAAFSGFDEEHVRAVISALRDKGVISDYRLSNWEKRQPKREDNSTERVRSMRERNAVKRDETQCNAPEERRVDTEENISSLRSEIQARAPAQPSRGQKKGAETPKAQLLAVLDEAHAVAVIEHRQKLRKPLSAHAAKLLAGKLAEAADPNAAADEMIVRGWQGFDITWHRPNGTGPPQRPKSMSARLSEIASRPHSETFQ